MELPFTHLNASDINSLERIVKRLPRGAVCVEIGSYLGASTIVIASNLGCTSKLYCVDTWMNDAMSEGPRDTYREFLQNTAVLSERITAVRSTSAAAASEFSAEIDFLFLDGDHSYDGCKADVEAWLPKVKAGGIVAFHDISWANGVKKVVREDIFPLQVGPADIGSNIYVARVGRQPLIAKAPCSAHLYVPSRLPDPSAAALTGITQQVEDRFWSWVSAGVERRLSTQLASQKIEVLNAGAPGLVAGRHTALKACQEDVIVYVDDDVTLPARWMESILEPFADPDIHFVGCRYLPDYQHEPPSWLEGLWQEAGDDFRILGELSLLDGGASSRPYPPMFVWGLCFAIRRETAIRLGGFNPDGYPWELRRFRGDGESGLTMKAEMIGLKAYYQGKTHVMHHIPASRMTLEYFERRSFLQGISDSYTQIRRDGGLSASPPRSWRDYVRPAKWKLERELILRKPTAQGVQRLTARSRFAGMQFHRNEVRDDPKLLDWVLREDYFDYRLPDGWEQYLGRPIPRRF
jgi:hypothetical protein